MVGDRRSPILGTGLRDFDRRIAAELPVLLDRLLAAPRYPRAQHPAGTISKRPGVYLFSDDAGRPIYVGQSRNLYNRIAQHTRESSSHVAASFAFNIAKREAAGLGIDIAGFREDLVSRVDFNEQFLIAKRAVAKLPVQFALAAHPDVRTVFEVYATYALGTQQ